MALDIQKKVGPLPAWGWAIVAIGAYEVYKRFTATNNSAQAPSGTAQNTTGATVFPTMAPGSMMPYSSSDQGLSGQFVSTPTMADLGQYAGPTTTPTPATPSSITPGSSAGPVYPGGTPFTLPTFISGGKLLDPTTGRPIYSGPNGEGGFGWNPGQPVPAGQSVYQMPDGRWASYFPNQNIQNGNRSALGLPAISNATSLAPGANPLVAGQLNGSVTV
jgi:hypothetical protein